MAGKAKQGAGGKKKKATRKPAGPAVQPGTTEEDRLPPLVTDVRVATLHNAVVTHDSASLSRLVAHYNFRKDLGKTNADRATLLMTAVKTNDLAGLQQLLGYGLIDINAREVSLVGGCTALHHACAANRTSMVEVLLRSGADPNVKAESAMGETALMTCCRHGLLACAQLLLRAGASTALADNFGNNASFWAYRHGHGALIRDLSLPAAHTPSAAEFLALQTQRIPGFSLPVIKAKAGKKGKGAAEKKK